MKLTIEVPDWWEVLDAFSWCQITKYLELQAAQMVAVPVPKCSLPASQTGGSRRCGDEAM